MNNSEFSKIRNRLGKTQKQLAQLLGVSKKAVQSFEQGWRNVPVHIERHLFFLLSLKDNQNTGDPVVCWEVHGCPMEKREKCPAWEFQAGDICWFINVTICEGKPQKNWAEKMKICHECEAFVHI